LVPSLFITGALRSVHSAEPAQSLLAVAVVVGKSARMSALSVAEVAASVIALLE
jgi:hypothetical protein